MSKNYGMMMSYKDAISWVESLPDDGKKSQVLNRMRYEKDKSDPVKPKFFKGKYVRDWYVCGNCGGRKVDVNDNFCPNCGFAIGWDSTRCLTGNKEPIYVNDDDFNPANSQHSSDDNLTGSTP